MAVSCRKWAFRLIKSSGAGGNYSPIFAGEAKRVSGPPQTQSQAPKSTERLWLGSKEGIGWNLVAVGKGEWWRGDQQENLGEGTVPQGQRGWREDLYWEEQLGWVSKGELPVIPGHILGRKGIAYTYLLPSQTRMIYTTSPSVSHSCSPTSAQKSFDGTFFFLPCHNSRKGASFTENVCAETVLLFPERQYFDNTANKFFFELVQLDFGITFFPRDINGYFQWF